MSKTIAQVLTNPRNIFLIDAIGALTTFIALVVILVQWNLYIGMPDNALILLSVLAIIFFLFSSYCTFYIKKKWGPYLQIIAFSNICYCLLTIILIFKHFESITTLGILYFSLEISIVCLLVIIEIKTIKSNQ